MSTLPDINEFPELWPGCVFQLTLRDVDRSNLTNRYDVAVIKVRSGEKVASQNLVEESQVRHVLGNLAKETFLVLSAKQNKERVKALNEELRKRARDQ